MFYSPINYCAIEAGRPRDVFSNNERSHRIIIGIRKRTTDTLYLVYGARQPWRFAVAERIDNRGTFPCEVYVTYIHLLALIFNSFLVPLHYYGVSIVILLDSGLVDLNDPNLIPIGHCGGAGGVYVSGSKHRCNLKFIWPCPSHELESLLQKYYMTEELHSDGLYCWNQLYLTSTSRKNL